MAAWSQAIMPKTAAINIHVIAVKEDILHFSMMTATLKPKPHQSHIKALQRKQQPHNTKGSSQTRSNGYWIPGINRALTLHLHRYVTCCKLRGFTEEQRMADLPSEHVDPSPPPPFMAEKQSDFSMNALHASHSRDAWERQIWTMKNVLCSTRTPRSPRCKDWEQLVIQINMHICAWGTTDRLS